MDSRRTAVGGPRRLDYRCSWGARGRPSSQRLLAYWLTKSWRPTAGALVAGWVGWWLAKAVKDWVERGRPFQEIGAANVRDTALHEGLGFVSGHATVAFACAAILAPYVTRRWQWVVYLLAAFVGLSRVVVGRTPTSRRHWRRLSWAHAGVDLAPGGRHRHHEAVGGVARHGSSLARRTHLVTGDPVRDGLRRHRRTGCV